eukprot:jgi/Mesvir1/27767/Mv07452-RA.1
MRLTMNCVNRDALGTSSNPSSSRLHRSGRRPSQTEICTVALEYGKATLRSSTISSSVSHTRPHIAMLIRTKLEFRMCMHSHNSEFAPMLMSELDFPGAYGDFTRRGLERSMIQDVFVMASRPSELAYPNFRPPTEILSHDLDNQCSPTTAEFWTGKGPLIEDGWSVYAFDPALSSQFERTEKSQQKKGMLELWYRRTTVPSIERFQRSFAAQHESDDSEEDDALLVFLPPAWKRATHVIATAFVSLMLAAVIGAMLTDGNGGVRPMFSHNADEDAESHVDREELTRVWQGLKDVWEALCDFDDDGPGGPKREA